MVPQLQRQALAEVARADARRVQALQPAQGASQPVLHGLGGTRCVGRLAVGGRIAAVGGMGRLDLLGRKGRGTHLEQASADLLQRVG